jgi:hypothetical protein
LNSANSLLQAVYGNLRCLLAKNHATFELNLSEEISRKQQNPILSRGAWTPLELFLGSVRSWEAGLRRIFVCEASGGRP